MYTTLVVPRVHSLPRLAETLHQRSNFKEKDEDYSSHPSHMERAHSWTEKILTGLRGELL